jgi:acyl dehydratase
VRFLDFKAGSVLSSERRKVTEQEIIEFATRYDPQWFHTDPTRARASRWRGIIASGWMTCSIAMQLAVTSVLRNSESIGSPGVEQLKWPNPLRPGDDVELRMEVLDTRVSRSGKVGVLHWRWVLNTQRNEPVLDLTATSLFELHTLS